MNVFIKLLMCACMALIYRGVSAQTDTLYLSTTQAEDIFIKQNLQLIAEKLNIDIADAAIMQAKLWPNPTLSIQDVNLWTTEQQRDGEQEIIPPLFGSFARNTQFALGLEQVILTGGKRRKLVEMEKVTRDIAVQYFEEVIRCLKVELRNTCAEILYLQEYRKVMDNQQTQLEELIANIRNQAAQGNVSQRELLRLQASLLEVRSEINELQMDMNLLQKELKLLLNNTALTYIILIVSDDNVKPPENLIFAQLIAQADVSRPDLKTTMYQKVFSEKSLRYEKSMRIPDLTFSATYDRAGGVTTNFVGFGVSMDLPFFDRNKGNIKAAQISLQQSQTLAELKQLEVHSEVVQAVQNYILVYDFSRQITGDFIANLDEMLESYTRNFVNKNIGIVEYLDFFEVYKENKRTMLSAQKNVKISFEELQYAVGVEL